MAGTTLISDVCVYGIGGFTRAVDAIMTPRLNTGLTLYTIMAIKSKCTRRHLVAGITLQLSGNMVSILTDGNLPVMTGRTGA